MLASPDLMWLVVKTFLSWQPFLDVLLLNITVPEKSPARGLKWIEQQCRVAFLVVK